MKLGIAGLISAGLVAGAMVFGCTREKLDAINPPTCSPGSPNCTCTDPERGEGCYNNWDKNIKSKGQDGGTDAPAETSK